MLSGGQEESKMQVETNFPLYDGCLEGFADMADVSKWCHEIGCDGLEIIWDHNVYHGERPGHDLAIGYHLMFWADWLDFWLEDEEALMRKFGSWDFVREYYRGDNRQAMVDFYRRDFAHAVEVGAQYVVFHVSDVSIEECFTFDFAHTDEQVIDASLELINQVFDGQDYPFALLVENQWWPGFTFTDPLMTQRLLDGIEHPDKGIMLDTGHLIHTDRTIDDEASAIAYINRMLDEHGALSQRIRGMHLHQSTSGPYMRQAVGKLPDDLDGDYWQKFARCYQHVLNIDEHQPWTDSRIADVVARIDPEWLNNELSAYGRQPHGDAVRTQVDTLRRGGLDI